MSTSRSTLGSLPTSMVALVFAALPTHDWACFATASRQFKTVSTLKSACPCAFVFFDAQLADREHRRRSSEAFRDAVVTAAHYGLSGLPPVTPGCYYRSLPRLPPVALRMSPRRVMVEADASRLLAIARSPQWCASLRSLVLVPVAWQPQLALDALSRLERLTELVLQSGGDAADAVDPTLATLPAMPHLTRLQCAGWFPTAQRLETLGKALPALCELSGLRHHTQTPPRFDAARWTAAFPHLVRCTYEAIIINDDDTKHMDATAADDALMLPPAATDLDLTVYASDRPTPVDVYRRHTLHRRVLDWPLPLAPPISPPPSASRSRPLHNPETHSYAFETLVRYGRLRHLVVRVVHLTVDPCVLVCRLPALRDLTVYAAHMHANCLSSTPFAPTILDAFAAPTIIGNRDFSVGCGGANAADGSGDGGGGDASGEDDARERKELSVSSSSCDCSLHLSSGLERLVLVGVLPGSSSIRLPPILMPCLRHLRLVARQCNFFPCGLPPTATIDVEVGGGACGGNHKL